MPSYTTFDRALAAVRNLIEFVPSAEREEYLLRLVACQLTFVPSGTTNVVAGESGNWWDELREVSEQVQCRNWRHPVTGRQCVNQVPVANRTWGLCAECVHKCNGGCSRIIPVFYHLCQSCKRRQSQPTTVTSNQPAPTTKQCRDGCGTSIPADGSNYCGDCGRQCAGPECVNVIPARFKYCQAQACQDAKWLEEHPPRTGTCTSSGAAAHRAWKRERAERDRKLRESMRGDAAQRR